LKNIQLEYLSLNTASLIQTLDMGITRCFKTLIPAKLVNSIVEEIPGTPLTAPKQLRGSMQGLI
jgi:hypothetical protein